MSRRTHRKSRNGCLSCKQRHIKCDETLPICVNCRTTARSCSLSQTTDTSPQSNRSQSSTTLSPARTAATPVPVHDEPLATPGPQQYNVNADHAYLLGHFITEISHTFHTSHDAATQSLRTIMPYFTTAPYLLHEVLAVSALHLSLTTSSPDLQEHYYAYATGLQTQALSTFNSLSSSANTSPSTSPDPATFLFSALIGLHTLCDTLRHHTQPLDLNIFLDRFTSSLQLHRGVRATAGPAWSVFTSQPALKPWLDSASASAAAASTQSAAGTECTPLLQMIEASDTSPRSRDAYLGAITQLQWAFDVDRGGGGRPEARQMLFAWAVMLPGRYVELLGQRMPEALVILAYYGVLLHRHRESWVVGDGGCVLVGAIAAFLGSWWKEWLIWPVEQVGVDGEGVEGGSQEVG